MKKWHNLLKYIDLYVYNESIEEMTIKYDSNTISALNLYEESLKMLTEITDNDSPAKYCTTTAKWEYDIALNYIREMNKKDREYTRTHLSLPNNNIDYFQLIAEKYGSSGVMVGKKYPQPQYLC